MNRKYSLTRTVGGGEFRPPPCFSKVYQAEIFLFINAKFLVPDKKWIAHLSVTEISKSVNKRRRRPILAAGAGSSIGLFAAASDGFA